MNWKFSVCVYVYVYVDLWIIMLLLELLAKIETVLGLFSCPVRQGQ